MTEKRDVEQENRRLRRELAMARLELRDLDCLGEPGPPDRPRAMRVTHALGTAESEWRRHIEEPPGPGWELIDRYIRGDLGLGWTWLDPYQRNGDFAWCGAFVAYCYGCAGLAYAIRHRHLASCYRLRRWALDNKRLLSEPKDLLPGDLLVVGPVDGPYWGVHIALVRRSVIRDEEQLLEQLGEAAQIPTYEGNAHSYGPEGARYEGVVINNRPFEARGRGEYRAMYGVRFQAEDFEGSGWEKHLPSGVPSL